MQSLQQPYEVGTIVIPILQIWKLRHGEPQDHVKLGYEPTESDLAACILTLFKIIGSILIYSLQDKPLRENTRWLKPIKAATCVDYLLCTSLDTKSLSYVSTFKIYNVSTR